MGIEDSSSLGLPAESEARRLSRRMSTREAVESAKALVFAVQS